MLDNQKELFIVVNEADEIIGYRTRYECHHDPRLIHRSVGVLVFDGDRFLLQKRSMKKDLHPGCWGISVGGHVGKGETDEEAARREMQEELGIEPPALQFVKKSLFRGTHETERDVLYRCEHKGPFTLDPDEVSVVRFFTREELVSGVSSGTLQLSEGALETMKQIHFL